MIEPALWQSLLAEGAGELEDFWGRRAQADLALD